MPRPGLTADGQCEYDSWYARRALPRKLPPKGVSLILAFDPGVSTGFAAISITGEVIETSTLKAEVVAGGLFLLGCKKKFPSSEVVIEKGPSHAGNYRHLTQQVEEALRRAYPGAYWVAPGHWKKHPSARCGAQLPGMSQHERDAVNLALWFLSRKQRV